jgi:hypothetical protein
MIIDYFIKTENFILDGSISWADLNPLQTSEAYIILFFKGPVPLELP